MRCTGTQWGARQCVFELRELRVHRNAVLDKGLQAQVAVKAGWRGPRDTHKGETSPKGDMGANTAATARAGVPGRGTSRAESWWDRQRGLFVAQNWRALCLEPQWRGEEGREVAGEGHTRRAQAA